MRARQVCTWCVMLASFCAQYLIGRSECLQVCRSDQDVKSALQAWCAYGQTGSTPADMFKQANPLRQAFASSVSKAVTTVDGGSGHGKQHRQVSRTFNLTFHRSQRNVRCSGHAPEVIQLYSYQPLTWVRLTNASLTIAAAECQKAVYFYSCASVACNCVDF